VASTLGSYAEFWPLYLRAHRDRRSRAAHYIGTSLALVAVAAGIIVDWRWMIAAPILGYGAAWLGHFGFEGNSPATFGHPLWSLASDLRMLALFATGRLGPHLDRAGVSRDEG
jgi:hypothetical protein